MKKILLFTFLIGITWFSQAQPNAWINEIHYDNTGTDENEAVEVVIENADQYTLSDFVISLYNGNNGSVYQTVSLDQFTQGTIVNGFTFFSYVFSGGIQNGAPDGLALSYQGTLISDQFLSYEGSFQATEGVANGLTSTDIGVQEPGEIGESLQLIGSGSFYNNFSWTGPVTASFGSVNTNQSLVSTAPDTDPPKWADGYPFAVGRDVNAVVYLKTDEPGMAYAIAVAPGSDAPTSEQVKAGADYGSVTVVSSGATPVLDADNVFIINLQGLTTNTDYDLWIVAEDDETTPNLQTDPVKQSIKTTTKQRYLNMTLPEDKDTIFIGDTLRLKWSAQYIDSLYIKVHICGTPGSFIITDDDDNPIVLSAFDQSFNFPIPSDAPSTYLDISLVDAADTSYSSNPADSVYLMDRRKLEWISPEDGDTAFVGDTVKLVWTAEYVDSIFFGGHDYTSGEDFIIEDDEGNPIIFDASLGSLDFPIPLDAETDSVMFVIFDAADPLSVSDTISPLYIVDTLRPEIDMLVPANGAMDIPYEFTAMIEFNETVTILTGNIYLNNVDGSVVKTYDLNGSNIFHDGSTISFPLDTVLIPGAGYYFTLDAGAVEDLQHNAFEGISDAKTWTFATADKQPYFSEYVEGSGNNKALEIFNPSGKAIDLSQYAIIKTRNGSAWESPETLNGTLAAGDVFTIVNPGFNFSLLSDSAAVVDTVWGSPTYFNGDDARAIVQLYGGSWDDDPLYVIIDQIGVDGIDPGSGWAVAGVTNATQEHTLIRKITVNQGNAIMGWDASAGTDAQNSEWMVFDQNFVGNLGYPTPNASDNTTITDVVLRDTVGNLVSSAVSIDSASATVNVTVIYSAGHMVDSLVPTITVADGGSAAINGDTIDFTNDVTFTVTAEDGLATRQWTIVVDVSPVASIDAQILSFSIPGELSDAVIDENYRTVEVEMPYGTDVTALTPEFEVSAGATADPPSGTTLDFSDTVKITVTAEDGTSMLEWAVIVSVFTPPAVGIYDIQYTTDASGNSPYIGEMVQTAGIITAVNIYQSSFKGYFLQDSAKAWNGIYVYDPQHDTLQVGDSVVIIGTVTEYYGLTEIKNVMDVVVVSQGNALPGPVLLTTGKASSEEWESVFVTFHHATCLHNDLGHGEVSVDDGTDSLIVDDFLYHYSLDDFVPGNVYNLTGVMNFSYGNYKLNPRSADDISDVTGVRNTFPAGTVNVYPNPSDGNFTVTVEGMTGENVRITILSTTGRVLLNREVAGNNVLHEQFNLSNVSRGLYFIRIDNGKTMTVKRIVIR